MKNTSGLNLCGNKEYFHGRMCYYGSQLAYVCGHAVEAGTNSSRARPRAFLQISMLTVSYNY